MADKRVILKESTLDTLGKVLRSKLSESGQYTIGEMIDKIARLNTNSTAIGSVNNNFKVNVVQKPNQTIKTGITPKTVLNDDGTVKIDISVNSSIMSSPGYFAGVLSQKRVGDTIEVTATDPISYKSFEDGYYVPYIFTKDDRNPYTKPGAIDGEVIPVSKIEDTRVRVITGDYGEIHSGLNLSGGKIVEIKQKDDKSITSIDLKGAEQCLKITFPDLSVGYSHKMNTVLSNSPVSEASSNPLLDLRGVSGMNFLSYIARDFKAPMIIVSSISSIDDRQIYDDEGFSAIFIPDNEMEGARILLDDKSGGRVFFKRIYPHSQIPTDDELLAGWTFPPQQEDIINKTPKTLLTEIARNVKDFMGYQDMTFDVAWERFASEAPEGYVKYKEDVRKMIESGEV